MIFGRNCFAGCDYCIAASERIGGAAKYPFARCSAAPLRTHAELDRITQDMGLNEADRSDFPQGVIGRSPFMDVPGFNVIRDITLDHTHALALGTVKRFIEVAFTVTVKSRIARTPRISVAPMNQVLSRTRTPSEFSRRTRPFDFSNYKGKSTNRLDMVRNGH